MVKAGDEKAIAPKVPKREAPDSLEIAEKNTTTDDCLGSHPQSGLHITWRPQDVLLGPAEDRYHEHFLNKTSQRSGILERKKSAVQYSKSNIVFYKKKNKNFFVVKNSKVNFLNFQNIL